MFRLSYLFNIVEPRNKVVRLVRASCVSSLPAVVQDANPRGIEVRDTNPQTTEGHDTSRQRAEGPDSCLQATEVQSTDLQVR